MGFFKCAEKMVAFADHRNPHIFGTVDPSYGVIGGSPVYIYAVLIKPSY